MPQGDSLGEKIRVGVSSCLLGEKVRWNGDHKKHLYVYDMLSPYFDWVATCPEVEIGMGIPRETVYLEGSPEAPRMIGDRTKTDWTRRMRAYSEKRGRELSKLGISGYIFKKNSPSCGLMRVKVYSEARIPAGQGRGLFASEVVRQNPCIPVEEEGRLSDSGLRENFIVRVFGYHRLQSLFEARFSMAALVRFHTAEKFLLLAHSRKYYDELGRLVAGARGRPPAEVRRRYTELYMRALSFKATTKRNVDVLMHMLGFLKKKLSTEEKRDILEIIQDYHHELVPLVVPVTLLGHYVRKHQVAYLLDQVYLKPHPKELMLRNHV